MGTGSFPGGKERPGRDADPSPPSSAVVMKGYSYTCTPPMGRTACTEPQCLYKGALYLYLWNWKFIEVSLSCWIPSHTWKETRHRLKLAVLDWPRFEYYNAVCSVVDFVMYARQLYANSTCCWASFGVRPGQQYGLKSSDVSVSAGACAHNVAVLCYYIVWRRYFISGDQ